IQGIEGEDITMRYRIVPWRVWPIITIIITLHFGIALEQLRIIIHALSGLLRSLRTRFSARHDSLGKLSLAQFAQGWQDIDQHPMKELRSRHISRNFPAFLVDVVKTARHIRIMANQDQ